MRKSIGTSNTSATSCGSGSISNGGVTTPTTGTTEKPVRVQ